MKDDTISRQAAINAICEHGTDLERRGITVLSVANHKQATVDLLENLPAAEPERPLEIQDILDYLDTVLHPIISPEYWNVYSELYDIISTLPSAERTGRWLPLEGDGYADGAIVYDVWECSNCGNEERGEDVPETNRYCRWCGAQMEVE